MEEAKIKDKLEGNQNNSHILSHTHTTQKKTLNLLHPDQPPARQEAKKK
jgi:hypothetical protein